MTLALRRSTMIRAIENCHSDIIISTRDLFNTWLGNYGKKVVIKSDGNTIIITAI